MNLIRTETRICGPDLKGDYVLVKNTTPALTTHVTSKLYVDTAVNKKQNTLTFMDSLVLNSIVVKPASSKLIYTPAIDGEIKATTLTIEDPFTEESINVKDTLNSKQNILIPGSNITIINDTISSSGGITQEQLDGKQETLSLNSQLGIKSLIVTNDTFSSATNVAGQVKCDSLEIQPGLWKYDVFKSTGKPNRDKLRFCTSG